MSLEDVSFCIKSNRNFFNYLGHALADVEPAKQLPYADAHILLARMMFPSIPELVFPSYLEIAPNPLPKLQKVVWFIKFTINR